jgi:hypothetical protein
MKIYMTGQEKGDLLIHVTKVDNAIVKRKWTEEQTMIY